MYEGLSTNGHSAEIEREAVPRSQSRQHVLKPDLPRLVFVLGK